MKAALIYFSVRVFAAIVGIVAIALYTRLVSPEAYGVFTLILSAVTTVYALGYQWIRASLLRFLPAQESLKGSPAAAAVIGYGWASLGLIGIATMMAFWPDPPWTYAQIALGLGCALALSAIELLLAVAQARRRPLLYATLTACRALGALAIGSSLAFAGYGAEGLLLGYLLAHGLPALVMLIWHKRRLFDLPFKGAQLRPLVDFGWPMAVIGIGGAVIGVSDRYMIAWLADTAQAGIYAAPYDLAQRTLNMLMLAAFLAYSPVVFRHYDQDERANLDLALKAQSRLMLVTGLPTALMLALFSTVVAQVFFGPEFREGAANLIPWIAGAALIQGWNSYYLSYGYTLTHKVAINAIVVITGAFINLGLNFILIPGQGALGAAIATLLTYGLLLLTSLVVTRRWYHLPWPVTDLLKMAVLATIAWPVFLMFQRIEPLTSALLVCAGFAAVFGFAMLVLNVGDLRGEIWRYWQRSRMRSA